MTRIAFIGAGSYGFTRKLVGDLLTYEALADAELRFMDIDPERLERSGTVVGRLLEGRTAGGPPLFTPDRDRALEGADVVVVLVKIGMLPPSFMDLDLPKKYGLKQTIGDTACVAGIFRGLRGMPWVMDLCADVERLCAPGAVILNYTNPQAMLVMAAAARSRVPFIGLCHSVQGTTRAVAEFLGVPYPELVYEAAGINHMSWLTRLEHRGEDLYPRLRSAIREQGIYEPVVGSGEEARPFLGPARLDLLNRLGYVVTESSTHLPEYVPFYARSDELIERYRVPVDQYKRNMERKAAEAEEFYRRALEGSLPAAERSEEYGLRIINAMVTGEAVRVYANVMNHGLIDNLPSEAAVEVACMADGGGVHPCRFGRLPTAPAALCSMEIAGHRLALEAILEADRRKVYQALMMDPLTHSVMDIDEMEQLVDELIAGQEEWLGKYLP